MIRIAQRRWTFMVACFAILVTFSASYSREMRSPDAANGKLLARSYCINCHVIPDTVQNGVPAGIPTFNEIANRPGQTADSIYASLILPHYPMPDTQLTNAEMHDIVAYIDRLRTDKGKPNLLPVLPKKKKDRRSVS